MTTMGTSRLAGALAPEFRDPLLAALLTEAPAATVVVDEGGHIVHANQAFLELHHLSSKDMGRHLRDASIDLWIQLEPVLDRVRDGFSVELNRVTLGHDCAPSRRYWEERWRPVHDDEGRVIATLSGGQMQRALFARLNRTCVDFLKHARCIQDPDKSQRVINDTPQMGLSFTQRCLPVFEFCNIGVHAYPGVDSTIARSKGNTTYLRPPPTTTVMLDPIFVRKNIACFERMLPRSNGSRLILWMDHFHPTIAQPILN